MLRDVSLSLSSGSIVLLMGPNGAGKSTLLRILAGLETLSSGSVSFQIEKNDPFCIQRCIGVLSHDAMLYADLSGVENLEYFSKLFQIQRSRERIEQLGEALALMAFWDRPVRSYSRGQLQRLALARTVLHEPRLVLLDEPTAALDNSSALLVKKVLTDLQDKGSSVLIITHEPEHFSDMATHHLELRQGRVATP